MDADSHKPPRWIINDQVCHPIVVYCKTEIKPDSFDGSEEQNSETLSSQRKVNLMSASFICGSQC